MTGSQPPVLIAGPAPLSEAVDRALRSAGRRVERAPSPSPAHLSAMVAAHGALGGLVIVAPPPVTARPFLEVDDADLETRLDRFLDLFETLGLAAKALIDGSAILYIGGREHLGAWDAAPEAAFAGAVAGLMRSAALELMPRRIRANVIATDPPGDGAVAEAADAGAIAALALQLLAEGGAVNGELILANQGASLRFREAKNRSLGPAAQAGPRTSATEGS